MTDQQVEEFNPWADSVETYRKGKFLRKQLSRRLAKRARMLRENDLTEESLKELRKEQKRAFSRMIAYSAPTPEQVKRLRLVLEMSQPMFARQIGVYWQTVAFWEQGKRKPHRRYAALMARLAATNRIDWRNIDEFLPRELQRMPVGLPRFW